MASLTKYEKYSPLQLYRNLPRYNLINAPCLNFTSKYAYGKYGPTFPHRLFETWKYAQCTCQGAQTYINSNVQWDTRQAKRVLNVNLNLSSQMCMLKHSLYRDLWPFGASSEPILFVQTAKVLDRLLISTDLSLFAQTLSAFLHAGSLYYF